MIDFRFLIQRWWWLNSTAFIASLWATQSIGQKHYLAHCQLSNRGSIYDSCYSFYRVTSYSLSTYIPLNCWSSVKIQLNKNRKKKKKQQLLSHVFQFLTLPSTTFTDDGNDQNRWGYVALIKKKEENKTLESRWLSRKKVYLSVISQPSVSWATDLLLV